MKQYPLLESKAGKLLFWPYLTAMLFLSRDTLFSSCIVGFQNSQIYMMALILLLGMWFLIRNGRNLKQILKDRRILAFVFLAMVILLPMLVKRDWQMMYFTILLCPLFAVFLTYFIKSSDVAKYYVVILTLLCAYSVIATYGIRKLAQAGSISPEVFFNSSGWDFYNFQFAYAVTWETWHRNFGIFREPGVYQFFILLAVYLNNYTVNWSRPWKMWLCNIILAVTMVTTFAVGGFAELGLFILFFYFDQKQYLEKWGLITAAVAVVLMLTLGCCIFYQVQNQTLGKTIFYEFLDIFVRLFTKSNSAVDRMDAILVNLQYFIKNPLVGDGIGLVLHGTNHNTSSTLLLYAILGFFGGTVNVAGWVALTWKRERSIFGNLVLLTILFMSFNTQNLVANVFFWLFPTMALVERGLPMIKLPVKKE